VAVLPAVIPYSTAACAQTETAAEATRTSKKIILRIDSAPEQTEQNVFGRENDTTFPLTGRGSGENSTTGSSPIHDRFATDNG
jgi:hypothetical protein